MTTTTSLRALIRPKNPVLICWPQLVRTFRLVPLPLKAGALTTSSAKGLTPSTPTPLSNVAAMVPATWVPWSAWVPAVRFWS